MERFELRIDTTKRSEMIDITSKVEEFLKKQEKKEGVLVLYVPHTTAGITINEGADPSVSEDILNHLDKLVPWKGNYRHSEGNAAAHIKAFLLGSSVHIFVEGGKLKLGTWQSIFFCEFDGPRQGRKIWLLFLPKE